MKPEIIKSFFMGLLIIVCIGLAVKVKMQQKETDRWKCIAGGFASDKILMRNQMEVLEEQIENQSPFEDIVQDVIPRKWKRK